MTSRSATRVEWLAAAFVAVLAPSTTRAQATDSLELTWRAPAECPSAENVRERIRTLAGTSAQGEPLQAEATVVREASGRFHLTLIVRRGSSSGERHIEGKSCEDLAGAAAVNLALLLRSGSPLGAAAPPEAQIQPSADSQPSGADAGEATTSSAQPSSAPEPEPEPESPSSGETHVRGLLQAPLLVFGVGPLPEPSFGLALAGGVSLDAWRFLAEAYAWLPQELLTEDPVAVSARVDRIEVGLRTCRDFPLGQVELAPCAAVSLVHVWARGSGEHVTARTDQSTWVAVALGGEARLSLTGWLSLVGRADVQIQTAQPSISIDGAGGIGEVGLLALKVTLGSEWIF